MYSLDNLQKDMNRGVVSIFCWLMFLLLFCIFFSIGNMSTEYARNRDIAFHELGLKRCNRDHNCHHMVFKSDYKHGRVPKGFDVDDISNLIPLPITDHNFLHNFIDSRKELRYDISMRVTIANLVFNGDICDYLNCPVPRHVKPVTVEPIKVEPNVVESYYIEPLDINADIKMRK